MRSADLIFVVGQNPGTNHPRMLTALETAKRRGARIVTVNPLPEPGLMRFKNPQTVRGLVGRGTPLADLFLQIRVNGDLALFKALNRLIIDAGAVDQDFVDSHCDGFDELRRDLEALSWADVEYATGLDRAQIEEAATLAIESERTVVCWAMGLTQHRNAVATIREIVNFLLLRGNIGRPGAGLCPVRGHSNVQGDRTMGICERPTPAFLDRLGQAFGVRAAARGRLRRGEQHPRDAGRASARVHGARRQLPARRAGHERHRRSPPADATDRARLHEAEPLAPRDRRPGADPAGARAERASTSRPRASRSSRWRTR